MGTWHVADLGDPTLADDALAAIRTRCRAARAAAGGVPGLAVFVRHESAGGVHCAVRVYFPPPAAGLARAAGAVPCPPPSPAGLGLLDGPPDAWPAVFPPPRP